MGDLATIDYAKSLFELRCRLDKDQIWVAEKLGVTDSTISNWETGRHVPKGRNAYKLVKLLREHNIDPIIRNNGNGNKESKRGNEPSEQI